VTGRTPRLGWYVHHHGRGHLTRLLAIAPHLDAEVDAVSILAAPAGLPSGWTWTVRASRMTARSRSASEPHRGNLATQGWPIGAATGSKGCRVRELHNCSPWAHGTPIITLLPALRSRPSGSLARAAVEILQQERPYKGDFLLLMA
jgi:hypothetical protein